MNKEEHSTSPVRVKTSFHWCIMNLMGETFLLLTKAYNNLRSSILTVRISGLGNKVKPSHLCMNHNVGWWISLVRGWYILVFLEISLQNFNLSKSCRSWSTSTMHYELNHRSKLNSFQREENSFPKSLNLAPVSVICRVHKNSNVKSLDPWSNSSKNKIKFNIHTCCLEKVRIICSSVHKPFGLQLLEGVLLLIVSPVDMCLLQ